MTATHVVDHIHDEPMSEVALRSVAIEALLAEKGLLTADEVRRQVNLMDGRTPADGARVVARAWVDEGFQGTPAGRFTLRPWWRWASRSRPRHRIDGS